MRERWKLRKGGKLQGQPSECPQSDQFLTNHTDNISSTVAQRPSFAHQVDTAISSSSLLPPSSPETFTDLPEDDDSWLEVSPDELDGMMQRATGRSTEGKETKVGSKKAELGEEHGKALGDLAKKVEAFVGGEGDLEGARFEE